MSVGTYAGTASLRVAASVILFGIIVFVVFFFLVVFIIGFLAGEKVSVEAL